MFIKNLFVVEFYLRGCLLHSVSTACGLIILWGRSDGNGLCGGGLGCLGCGLSLGAVILVLGSFLVCSKGLSS